MPVPRMLAPRRLSCLAGHCQAALKAQTTSFFFSSNAKTDCVKTNLIDTLRSSGGSISQSAIHAIYHQRFGIKLDPKSLGYENILALSRDIPGVSIEPAHSENAYPCIVLDDWASSLAEERVVDDTDSSPSSWVSGITENGTCVVLVDTKAKLDKITSRWPFDGTDIVAVDCEGEPDDLLLVQVYSGSVAYVFDCIVLGPERVCRALQRLLGDPSITKVFYDVHRDAVALQSFHDVTLEGVFDAQLAMETLTGHYHLGFADMMNEMDLPEHPLKTEIKARLSEEGAKAVFACRPLDTVALQYAAYDVSLLFEAHRVLEAKLEKVVGPSALESVKEATSKRVSTAIETDGHRQICFDAANDYRVVSHELLSYLRPEHVHLPSKALVKHDIDALLPLLPDDCKSTVLSNAEDIIDIVLDRDRKPHVWAKGQRIYLQNKPIYHGDIEHIENAVPYFGTDNRSTLEGQIHRISCIRNRDGNITGMTLRVGRYVEGVATLITDVMSSSANESILFLGGPGSGKTTILRDATRILAETQNVCVVDKSNEIGGDGDVPHPCIGHARRLMVHELDKQADVMIECVQNHTPQCIVVDEIGRAKEVFAAETCKNRGVRMIATAHGDLRTLVENKALHKLIGGVETAAIGDAQARRESRLSGKQFNKLRSQRAGRPIFDVVVELQSGIRNECRIVFNPGQAVDDILEGRRYKTHRRRFDPELGRMSFVFEKR